MARARVTGEQNDNAETPESNEQDLWQGFTDATSGHVIVQVKRLEPAVFNGVTTAGFLGSLTIDVTQVPMIPQLIADKWGGGLVTAQNMSTGKDGKYGFGKSVRFRIAGMPTVGAASSGGASTAPAPAAPVLATAPAQAPAQPWGWPAQQAFAGPSYAGAPNPAQMFQGLGELIRSVGGMLPQQQGGIELLQPLLQPLLQGFARRQFGGEDETTRMWKHFQLFKQIESGNASPPSSQDGGGTWMQDIATAAATFAQAIRQPNQAPPPPPGMAWDGTKWVQFDHRSNFQSNQQSFQRSNQQPQPMDRQEDDEQEDDEQEAEPTAEEVVSQFERLSPAEKQRVFTMAQQRGL
jgi:hypothetical protein